MPILRLLTLLFLCLIMSAAIQAEITTISNEDKEALSKARETLVKILEENIIPFWYPNVIDEQDGGYMLNHDINGKLTGRANKALVTQARTVWFFSRLYRSPFGKPEHLKAAQHGYEFFTAKMRDLQSGGYFWEVNNSGAVATKPDKHLYGQSFALYALSEYARVSNDPSAKSLAQTFFSHLDYFAHDQEHGGYNESFQRDWMPLPSSSDNYMGVQPHIKLMNTHLHLLEAFTTYYQTFSDPICRERLIELIMIESSAVIRKGLPASTDKYHPNWVPLRGPQYDRVSYGHDIENIWLLREACDAAGIETAPLMDLFRQVFGYSLKYGFDSRSGGFYDTGAFHSAADQKRKVWWVQAEGLVSALTMYQLTGDNVYLETYNKTLDWINTKQVDWENGDWFSSIETEGTPSGSKASAWKSPYHNGRAMLECIRLSDAMLALPESN